MPPFSVSAARNSPYPHPISTNQSKGDCYANQDHALRRDRGHHLDACGRMQQGIRARARPYSAHEQHPYLSGHRASLDGITCLRDALLHLTNDGDFQSCAINWARLEVSHYFGEDTSETQTVKVRTRVWELRGQGENADCFA
jgi:hypothetical protein